MKNLSLFLYLFCFASLIHAQEPTVDMEISVKARQVKVRVLSDAGLPVQHLSRDLFTLKVDGKPVSDFDFREVSYSQALPRNDQEWQEAMQETEEKEPQRRLIIMLLDSRLLNQRGFENLKRSMASFIDRLQPSDMVRIYQSERTLQALSGFSANKYVLKKALDEAVLGRTAMTDYRAMNNFKVFLENEVSDDQDTDAPDIEAIRDFHDFVETDRKEKDTDRFLNHLEIMADVMEPAYGDKVLYLFTAGFPIHPGNTLTLNRVTRRLNGSGISLHTVIHRDTQEYTDGITPVLSSDTGQEREQDREVSLGPVDNAEMVEGPMALIHRTGGTYIPVSNAAQSDLIAAKIEEETFHYYVLTYYEGEPFDKVAVDIKGADRNQWEVLFGKTRQHAKTFAKRGDSSRERLFEATLVYGAPMWELDAEVDLFYFQTKKHPHVVAFHGKLGKTQPGHIYRVGWLATNDEQEIVGAGKSTIEIPEEMAQFAFYDLLVMDKKPTLVRFYVRDEETGEGNLFEKHLGVDLDDGPNLSSLVVFQRDNLSATPLYPARKAKDLNVDLLQEADPFFHHGHRLNIAKKDHFDKNRPIWVLFYLQNLTRPLEKYRIDGFLDQANERIPAGLTIVELEALDNYHYRALGVLEPKNLKPGTADLTLEIMDPRVGVGRVNTYTFRLND